MSPASLFSAALASPPTRCAAAAFALAALATPIVMRVARAKGLVAKPRADRWHTRPTALFGGVAIFAAVAITGIALLPHTRENLAILFGAATIFAVGVIDDALHIKPSSKLLGQIGAACIAALGGVRVEFLQNPLLAIPLAIFWIVAITNAFNLLDNMDGLSAGVAAISAFFLVLFAHLQGNPDVTQLAATLGGAAAGFLLWNFNPAKIFMGDCGSMVLGYVLGCVALVGTWHEASNLVLVLAAPAMLLAVPIFDTTLVTILRTMSGRPISQGGRDHSSHRLVALGMSERRAVIVLYFVCGTFGLVALGGLVYNLFAAAVGGLLLLVGIFFFGVFLGQVPVYGPVPKSSGATDPGRERPALLNAMILHKRRIAEVAIDFVLVCAAYAGAYLLRYEGAIPSQDLALIATTLPILVVVKLTSFFLFGVYRGVWKYVGIRDAVNLAKAVVAGSVATVLALLLAFRFEGMSRSVFVLDGLLLLFFAAGSRIALRVFRETLSGPVAGGRRVLVIGAGDGGEMLLREMRNNTALGMAPVGLVDDDPEKQGRWVHGVMVEGTRAELADIVTRTLAEEIVIAIPSAPGPVLSAIAADCAATGLPYRTTQRVTELVDGRVTLAHIRELEILDLLPRRAPQIDDARVRAAVSGRAIAVIGAGGTLGTALAQRAAALGAARLLLVDRDDNALSRVRDAVARVRGRSDLVAATTPSTPGTDAGSDGAATADAAVLIDANDGPHLAPVLSRFRPDAVIHVASLSQLGLLEENAVAAARVNVLGTRYSAVAASVAGAKTFVLASTLKAAASSSVLGATRRLAEAEALSLSWRATKGAPHPTAIETRVVRLGNVLGARGGILGRFREQALAGGPLTLTHPDAARFVLSADEAASALLLAAGPLPDVPDAAAVCVPDLGDQVKIADLAQAVIRWIDARRVGSHVPLEVKTSGLRPGESLRDPDLPSSRAPLLPGLDAFVPDDAIPLDTLHTLTDPLEIAIQAGDERSVRTLLAEWVTGFPAPGADRDNVIELHKR